MSLPNQIAAFPDCADAFERAAAAPKGSRFCLGPEADARVFRFRLQHYRQLLRKDSQRLYPLDDPRHNRSEFDGLICRLREDAAGEWWVYIEPAGAKILAVEDIEPEEAPNFIEAPPKMLEHHPLLDDDLAPEPTNANP